MKMIFSKSLGRPWQVAFIFTGLLGLTGCDYLSDAATIAKQGQAAGASIKAIATAGMAAQKGQCELAALRAALADRESILRAQKDAATVAAPVQPDRSADFAKCIPSEARSVAQYQRAAEAADAFSDAFASLSLLAGDNTGKSIKTATDNFNAAAGLLKISADDLSADTKENIGQIAQTLSQAFQAHKIKNFALATQKLVGAYEAFSNTLGNQAARDAESSAAKKNDIYISLGELGMLDTNTMLTGYLDSAGIKVLAPALKDPALLMFQKAALSTESSAAARAKVEALSETASKQLQTLQVRIADLSEGAVTYTPPVDAKTAAAGADAADASGKK